MRLLFLKVINIHNFLGKICMKDIKEVINKGCFWLKNSGIINSSNDENLGGVRSWYDPDQDEYGFYYSEITGYMISTLLYINQYIDKDSKNIQLACSSKNWLIERMYDSDVSGFKCRHNNDHNKLNNRICTFDNGMILSGLVELHKVSNSDTLSEQIFGLDALLSKNFLVDDNNIAEHRYLPHENNFESEKIGWSNQNGSFLIKSLKGLLSFYDLSENKNIKDLEKIFDKVVLMQSTNGQFITDKYLNTTFLHPQCYTIEGLIVAYEYFNKESYKNSIIKGLMWMLSLQNINTGGFSHFVSEDIIDHNESVDINAQVLRIWIVALSKKWIIEDNNIELLIKRIISYQNTNQNDQKSFGGFRYGYSLQNEKINHINCWGTMFSIQALDYADKYFNNSFKFDANLMV